MWADIEGGGELAVLTFGSSTGPVREAIARAAANGVRAKLVAMRLIAPALPEIPKSQRVIKERQKPLFAELVDTKLPQVDLLDAANGRQEGVAPESLEMTSRLIEKKLKDFGVEVRVVAASPGPVITRYEIEPATGVKGAQVVGLARDLARSLSLISIRVVEVIPGKSVVGPALTLQFMPKREDLHAAGEYAGPERQLHRHVLYHTQPGDVVVVDARGNMASGVFGALYPTR